LRRLERPGLRRLRELVGELRQELRLGAARLAGGVLEAGRKLGRHRLELGWILL
jgi:hypothetical protein